MKYVHAGSFRAAGLLTAAILLVWSTALPGGFVWIDWSEIDQAGYRITSASDFIAVWTQSLEQYVERFDGTLDTQGGYFRPVYAMSISLDWLLWRGTEWLYHAENILWHLAVVLGLHAIGKRLLLQSKVPNSERIAFWSALIFAVHPLGVHSTTWISGRKDLLCAAFSLMSLIFYRRARGDVDGSIVAQNANATPAIGRIAINLCASAGFLLVAIFSKEQAYVVPLFATAWAWFDWPPRDHPSYSGYRKSTLAALTILWGINGCAMVYRVIVLNGFGLGGNIHSETWIDRVGTASRLWWTYIGRIFWPLDPTIVDRWQVSLGIGFTEAFSILSLIGITLLVFYASLRRWPIAIFFLWYMIWMLPTSGCLPLRHLYAERYLYPSMWGLIAIGVYGVFRIFERRQVLRISILLGIFLGLAAETFSENKHWWNDDVLFERAVTQDPFYVEGRIGTAAQALKRNDFGRVIEETRMALASADDARFISYWSPFIAHTNIGLAFQRLGQFENATKHFKLALESRPNNAIAYYHLGLSASGLRMFDQAEKYYQKALQLKPNDYLTKSNLGYVFLNLNMPEECVGILSPLAKANPGDLVNLSNLASALLVSGRLQDAEHRFEELVVADTDNPVYLAKLAWVEWKLEKYESARSHLAAASKLAPDDPTVQGIAAIILKDETGLGSNR